ncbi:MAG: hypothetical protein JXQ83_03155 [Candidatus Glassbacteria bacterium]|nr:hypothetical protein [Candidatus Glassbacteria bacterium]
MNRTLKRMITGLGLVLFLAVVAIFCIVITFRRGDNFDPAGPARLAVWFSKRVVAQASSYLFELYDPYLPGYRYAPTGPPGAGRTGMSGQAMQTCRALQDFLDDGAAFQGARVSRFLNWELPDSHFRFYYQAADEARLDSLRELYSPAGLKARGEDDYLAMAGISRWLHNYFRSRTPGGQVIPRVDFNFNALDILYRAGQGERFWCSEYATTLVQCLASLGYTARYVMLNSEVGGHVACEAWSESHAKWVLLDPFYCRRATLDRVPLNALEVHRLAAEPQAAARVKVIQQAKELTDLHDRAFYLRLFRNLAVRMRNDWFTNRYPHWYPLSNSVMNAVEWQDELTCDNIYYRYETAEAKDLYWPLNRTRVSVLPAGAGCLTVLLETFTPNFSHFRLAEGDNPTRKLQAGVFEWRLRPGLNLLRVAAVNRWEVAGREAVIEIEWSRARSELAGL